MQQKIYFTIGLFLLLEIYIFQAIRTLTKNSWIRAAYIAISVISYSIIVYQMLSTTENERGMGKAQIILTTFLILILPKIFIVLFLLIDDSIRVLTYLLRFFTKTENHYPERRKFLQIIGLGFGGLLSALFLDGMIFGRFRHTVRRVKIKINNLPQSFKGYKIVQISDVHSGSFSDPSKLQPAIDLINEQKPDLVLFTGDLVNNTAEEFKPFISLFSQINARDGKFSVLGNHDYGNYVHWKNEDEKADNLNQLIDFQKQAGFEVLRNENRSIDKNGEQLYILGVENWGIKPFPQFGDLNKALKDIPKNAPKILMSHDPTHFDYIVKNHPIDVQLTLSGHTHGMQFGLDLKNIKWSPVQYKYSKWADLYESNGKYLYVNRGFGVLAYLGRVGVLPEITLIELS